MPEVVVSSKGQIVLPKDVREAIGLKEGDRVCVEVEGDHVSIRRTQPRVTHDWRRWRGHLAGTQAIEDHLAEHADEVKNEYMP
ncbi:MAG: AbrB/MazE/SpoVT family DNA-binding domain-containing protein [Deltaproteobacteria bacterium]|nr:AbrB/MazE/SpoVT family DNA-binding domain-containing protein [Deltaproteobacteria bacterium]